MRALLMLLMLTPVALSGERAKYTDHKRVMYYLDAQGREQPVRTPVDFYELVAALAPRTFFPNSPLNDSNFDVAGVRKGVAEAQKVCRLLGAPTALQVRHPDCPHDFPPEVRREAYQTLDRVLGHRPVRDVP
ncbi:MAG: hypothetical protein WC661_22010 [Opitutaceae bacterium]|jgi:hypothetical protein